MKNRIFKPTVDLWPASSWVCPCCSQKNFSEHMVRAERVEDMTCYLDGTASPAAIETMRQIIEQVGYVIELVKMNHVTCQKCQETFDVDKETDDPWDGDDDDEGDAFGFAFDGPSDN